MKVLSTYVVIKAALSSKQKPKLTSKHVTMVSKLLPNKYIHRVKIFLLVLTSVNKGISHSLIR